MSKDIKAIIYHLNTYLTKNGLQNIDPVKANAILAKAGLLTDRKDRPGKPLRDLLRKGHLPHAYQVGGRGSSWRIPHSEKQAANTIMTNTTLPEVKKTALAVKVPQVPIAEILQLERMLMNQKEFKSAGSIDKLVSNKPGLYCIRISDLNKLPKPFNTFLAERKHNIIYIGIASESLNKRFLNQELRANGHGTFFRSIGAVLGYRPLKGSLGNKANKRNYKFTPKDEKKIIEWINKNLIVNWVEYNGDFDRIETELISKYRPLLNLAKNPSALQLLSDLRKECIQIANEI